MESGFINRVWSTRFDRKKATSRVVVNAGLPAWKPLYIRVFLVVKVRPPEAGIFPTKCAWLHESEIRPGVCAHPDDVAGVLRDAWVDEDNGDGG